MTPRQFAYYIAENWILSFERITVSQLIFPVQLEVASKWAGGHLKPLLKIMWFFHLADKDVSWNVSLFWTLSIFSLFLHSSLRGTKINPASYYYWFRWGKRVGVVIRCDCCRIVFGDLLWFWRCWQTSKLLGLGPWDDMLSHQWYSIFIFRRRSTVVQIGLIPWCALSWLMVWMSVFFGKWLHIF